jgi:hypothetical protein
MSVLLAEKNKSNASIIISSSADRVLRFAARELSSYLKKISGADFVISEEYTAPSISRKPAIAISVDASNAHWSGTSGKTDAFSISARDGHICICGKNGRSALYGVYEFLEKLGCGFIEPGKETVPSKSSIVAEEINQVYISAFLLRNIFRVQIVKSKTFSYDGLDPEHHLPQIDWMAKRRLNHYEFYVDYYRYDLWEKHKHKVLDALLDRGFDIEVTHHSIHYFCPPDENHDFGSYGPSTYRCNHPDWYAGEQTNIELPAVQELLQDRYLEYVRNNKELCKVGLWPADTGMNSSPEGYLKFWNRIGKALAAEFPEKQLSIVAYLELLTPPKGIVPESNLFCWFCPIRNNYMYPSADKSNKGNLGYMQTWIHTMPPEHVACFEYYGWQAELTPMGEKMKQDLGVYHDMKLGGIYGWAGFTYNLMGNDFRWARDMYVLSHLQWDPVQDIVRLEEKWANGVFGTAASDIQDFYDTLKRAHKKESRKGLLSQQPWISLDLLHDVQKILASARSHANDPEILRRLNMLEKLAGRGCTEEVLREPRKGPYAHF